MKPLPTAGVWNQIAFEKLSKVFGTTEGERIMIGALRSIGLDSLESPEDLGRFAGAVRGFGGYADAVGALLSLTATLRGSSHAPQQLP